MRGNFSHQHPCDYCCTHELLQMSSQAAVLVFFFLTVVKLSRYIYKGSSDKVLFFYGGFYKLHTSFILITS